MTNTLITPKPELNHYYLFAGEVYFELPEVEGFSSIRLNTLLVTDTQQLPLTKINKVQQGLQVQFHKKAGSPDNKIVDVVIMGSVYLGLFTKEEFEATPEGLVTRLMGPMGHA